MNKIKKIIDNSKISPKIKEKINKVLSKEKLSIKSLKEFLKIISFLEESNSWRDLEV